MKTTIQHLLPLLALGGALLGGCSSGGNGGSSTGGQKFTPNVLDSEITTGFQVHGTGYAPLGGSALIRLVAASGTPFQGGTQGEMTLPATIASPTLLTGMTMPFGVVGTAPVNVTVILPDGGTETTTATVQGPTLTAFEPEGIVTGMEKPFTITGSGLGDSGLTVGVRFTSAASTPFEGGTSATLIAVAEVVSSTRLQGKIPEGAADYAAAATVEVLFPSGSRTTPAPVSVEFAPVLELWASDGASEDCFGESVGVSDAGAIVGAPRDDDQGLDSGAAYVFSELTTPWTDQAKLVPADGAAKDSFGHAVARTDDTALVGAPRIEGGATDAGAAYVFGLHQGAWTEEAKLVPGSGLIGNHFGFSVCLSGDTAIVGSPLRETNPAGSGSVHVFVRDGAVWTEQQRLQPPPGQDYPMFGSSVALSSETLVVGALAQAPSGDVTGTAFAFHRDGSSWTQEGELLPFDGGHANDAYGYRVGLSGDTAVVSAFGDDDHGPSSGSVYVFVRENGIWEGTEKLVASDGTAGGFFGLSVAIAHDTLVVGAPNGSTGLWAGAAYVFTREGSTWAERKKLQPANLDDGAGLGTSVALSEDCVLVGAPDPDAASADYGQAFIF